ncbi:MAG: ATP-binding protein [Muribaculaceae bacterium]|nr:ATP-binding protein [Muribaculaceae bacterium]
MTKEPYYPIGEQDFKSLREMGSIYVDKTRFIEKLIFSGSKYYFLARPRRFGKSLFLSTIRYFFQAERSLFKGLAIDSTKWDWQKHPVLRLDLNMERYAEPGRLDMVLDNQFNIWEKEYDVIPKAEDLPSRFKNIIAAAHAKFGRQVVILVDEYDKPLVGNLDKDKEELFEHYRAKLASIYSNFKSSAEHIRIVFLTGVSRFSKLSVFSDLNNLNDITFDDEYADICGITEKELIEYFSVGIHTLAERRNTSFDEARHLLKKNYDGYRFAKNGSEIYNPWSILCALSKKDIANYWVQTGMATLLGEALKCVNVDLEDFLNTECLPEELVGLDLKDPNPLALLYQTGYLTIKDFDFDSNLFTLGVPNNEVKEGLFKMLIPYYTSIRQGFENAVVTKLTASILKGKPNELIQTLETYFAGIPYQLHMDNENNFQNAFYILVTLIGIKAHAEVATSDGRIDLLITTPKFIYIIELKYDRTAREAMAQIDEKKYTRPYRDDPRTLFKIGVNFSSETRCIEKPEIEEVPPHLR